MFKKFTPKESVSGFQQIRQSAQRGIRTSIASEFPTLEPVLEELLPKKQQMFVAKCHEHVSVVVMDNVPLFFQQRDGPFMPTLRLLHQYPDIMPKYRVDRGAIKFVLSGANIMCPGLTHPASHMDDVPAETAVAIYAEGKENALAVGITKMSSQEIRDTNKGIGVEVAHYLKDGLWGCPSLE
mmetsp:Transcript_14059/g.33222  ORF Transcript_14059/g.33222 Transcript_14059/m.33222 type:complete len:182 (+) Transcript_14059:14-559(+)